MTINNNTWKFQFQYGYEKFQNDDVRKRSLYADKICKEIRTYSIVPNLFYELLITKQKYANVMQNHIV